MFTETNDNFSTHVEVDAAHHNRGDARMSTSSFTQHAKQVGAVLYAVMPYLYLTIVLMLVFQGHAFAEDDGNYFKGALGSVQTAFGDGSGFEKLLYAAEAVATGAGWLFTKSPKVLIGLPVLMIITHFFFKLAMPTS